MSALLRMRVGVVGVGLASLLVCTAYAQQQATDRAESAREKGSAAAQADIEGTSDSGQAGRAESGQAGRNRAEQSRPQNSQRPAAGSQGHAGAGNNQEVEQFIVECLLQKNQNEIEAGQLAEQQSQNADVKKFAQMLVKDHQQMVKQIQQLQQGATQRSESGTREQTPGTSTRIESQRQGDNSTPLPGSSGAGQPAGTDTSTEVRAGLGDSNQSLTIDTQSGQAGQQHAGQHGGGVPQLLAIDRAINERCAAALKEELQQKEGAEFDMAFVGSQISGHMHMVSTLEVLSQQGPEQVQQLAQQALPKVQAHLDHARQLIEQLKDGALQDDSQAERPQPGAAGPTR